MVMNIFFANNIFFIHITQRTATLISEFFVVLLFFISLFSDKLEEKLHINWFG